MKNFIEILLPPRYRTWYMFMLVGFVVSQIIATVGFYSGLVSFIPLYLASSASQFGAATPLPVGFCLMFLWEYRKYSKSRSR